MAHRVAGRRFDAEEGETGLRDVWLTRARTWTPDATGLEDLAADLLAEASPPTTDLEKWLHYEAAVVLDHVRALDSLRAGDIHQLDPLLFREMAILEGKPGPDALVDFEAAIEAHRENAITRRNMTEVQHYRMNVAVARGQISVAADLLDTLSRVSPESVPDAGHNDPWFYLIEPIEHALVEPGWEAVAEWAAAQLLERGPGRGARTTNTTALVTWSCGRSSPATSRHPATRSSG